VGAADGLRHPVKKGFMKMVNLKKISAVLACCMAFSVLATACGSDESDDDTIVANVITSLDEDGEEVVVSGTTAPADEDEDDEEGTTTQGTTVTSETTAYDIDDDGLLVAEIVTDNAAVTAATTTAPTTTKQSSTGTLSDEEIQAVMTATATQATTVVTAAVDNSTRYGYNTLDDDEKALYDAILGAASTMNFKIYGTDNLTMEKWAKVFGMVYNQEPQLFWLNSKIKIGRLYFNETDTDKIASMQKEIDATVNTLVKEANTKSTTYEKLKVFHDYLVLNSTFQKNEDVGNYNQSIYNAFAGGTSSQGNIQCSGYAKGMQYLCDQVGIECMIITGTNESGSTHAWNKVKVDGEWYNLDATWDDPILSTPIYNYLRYTYFLVPDSWIVDKTHFNVNKVTLSSGKSFSYFTAPKATATAQNYFVKNNLVYSDFDSADKALKKALEDTASSGGAVAEIMVSSKDIYNKITSDLKGYQTYIKGKNSKVKGVANNCNENMLIIQLDVKYN
jgi:transglutaminase/protease-like cytokinesis protein 3